MKKSQIPATVDKSRLSSGDVIEAGYMLEACATTMRQSFGVISMFNDLSPNPMSESELKTFAQHFDVVHKTCRTYARALFDFANKMKDEKTASAS